jgi:AraC-like DNA-binding protein
MQAKEFVRSYLDAWNHRDPQAVADHLVSDGIYCDVPANAQRSPSELILDLEEFFAKFQHRYELIGEILKGTGSIAYQYQMSPTQACDCVIRGCDFITWNGDAAMIITDYYEMQGMSPAARVTQLVSHKAAQPKYAKSGLSDEQLVRYKKRLKRIMKSKRLYTKPDITLPQLAQTIDCSVNHLSQVINSGLGMSFFDYVNHYRIELAKELLADPDERYNTVLNIAFAVGFNSNSAFYTAFRKHVGQTPAQYRKRFSRSD